MSAMSFIMFSLWVFAIRCECSVEILRPLGAPDIQPLLVQAENDEETKMMTYTLLLRGPPDTKEDLGTPLIVVNRSQEFSVLKAERKVPVGQKYIVNFLFNSSSTTDSLKIIIKGDAVTGLKKTIFNPKCQFEVKKETINRITKYSGNAVDCDQDPENEGLYFAYISAKLRDGQGETYSACDEAMGEYATCRNYITDPYVSLNEENMRKNGIEFVEGSLIFNLMVAEQTLIKALPFYGWEVNL